MLPNWDEREAICTQFGTSVKCSVRVGEGKPMDLKPVFLLVTWNTLFLNQHLPLALKVGWLLIPVHCLLSAGEGGQWEAVQPRGGETEQIMPTHPVLVWAGAGCPGAARTCTQSSHVAVSNYQLIQKGSEKIKCWSPLAKPGHFLFHKNSGGWGNDFNRGFL